MSQTVPTGIYSSDAYAVYAESFDLSLLPNDGEVPLSPQSELTSQSPLVSLDYIPATIYHDQPMKIEKPWSENEEKYSIKTQDTSVLLQQLQKNQQPPPPYQFYPSPLPSPPQDTYNTIYPPSPCPSIEQNFTNFKIKQEFLILPPSPPESSGSPSPFNEIKSEPDTDTETLIDINSLLDKSFKDYETKKSITTSIKQQPPQDHQLLREYLQDTSFQRKHNLKPLALESLIGGLGVRGDIEPVISLALEHAKRDAQAMCATLKISPDPHHWTTNQVHAWIRSTIEQFKLPHIDDLEMKFPEDGTALSCLTEEEFHRRAPQAGGTIHAQLEIWKLACSENFPSTITNEPSTSNWSCTQNMDISDDEDEDLAPTPSSPAIPTTSNISTITPSVSVGIVTASCSTTITGNVSGTTTTTTTTTKTGRTGGSHIHLWQFLKELLASPQIHGSAIRWLDRNKGVFKIEDSVRVAKLWGKRKNRPAMNYDKLSRSIRQYYKKGIMKKTERSQRLVYQFCHPYCL